MNKNEQTLIVENGRLVLPDRIEDGASMRVENGMIVEIGRVRPAGGERRIDASGCVVLPGIIDLHSDALEKELEPRPNTLFPTDMVLLEMDTKLAACGITTMYHSISFADGEIGVRSNKMAESIIQEIHRLSSKLRVRTKVHARYELTDEAAAPVLKQLIEDGRVHLLSFMDHTPGQGQFRDAASYRRYLQAVYHKTAAEISKILVRKTAANESIVQRLDDLANLCVRRDIPMASHDDDSAVRIEWLARKGISISEFPVNMEAASAAGKRRLHVCLGAPNALRGCSQAKNLCAREAVARGLCHILCSDYAPMTLIHGAFKLAHQRLLPLHEAVRLVTLNPARAVGIDHDTGSLQEDKAADFIIVNQHHSQVLKTFVAGQEVFSTCLK